VRTRAIFGRGYAAEPDALVEQLRTDEAVAEADTLLLTIPNQLGVDYCAHVIAGILKHVARHSSGADPCALAFSAACGGRAEALRPGSELPAPPAYRRGGCQRLTLWRHCLLRP
jgi:hypothetical protein